MGKRPGRQEFKRLVASANGFFMYLVIQELAAALQVVRSHDSGRRPELQRYVNLSCRLVEALLCQKHLSQVQIGVVLVWLEGQRGSKVSLGAIQVLLIEAEDAAGQEQDIERVVAWI